MMQRITALARTMPIAARHPTLARLQSAASQLVLLALFVLAGQGQSAHAEEAALKVAVAANFAGTFEDLAQAFAQSGGHRAQSVIGSTATLEAQIRAGAPFAVFMAADAHAIDQLQEQGLIDQRQRFTYAIGRLVLWRAQLPAQDALLSLRRGGSVSHLAIADAKLAPYGQAAQETLRAMGLDAAWKPYEVVGNNIAQTYEFVASGNAPMGFVALSQLLCRPQCPPSAQTASKSAAQVARMANIPGSYWLVPADLHHPLVQDVALLKAAEHDPAALAWMQFLRTEAARAIIARHGYELPRVTREPAPQPASDPGVGMSTP